MFLQLLWFCSTPGEPLGKMGDHFPDQLSGPLYCRGTKIEAENRSPTFRTLHIFLKYPFCRCDPKAAAFLALEQLLASPLRTGTPFGGHQHR